MDETTIISLIYIGISFLFAYFWGRKRQIGFWWSFFLMLGFLPGWMVMLNDHLTETDPKPEKSNEKIIVGIILMMLSTYLLYLLLKDSAEKAFNEYLILTLTLSWFFGLGYYFFQRGSGVAFNHKPQKTTNTNTEAGAVGNTTSEPKIQTSHQSNTVPSLILKPLNNSGVNQKYESQSNQQTVSKTELPSKPLPLTSVVVGYNLELEENSGCYPVLRIPKKGSTIRSYREGKTRRRGFKEEEFQKSITQYFGDHFLVSGQARINTGVRPFEPDIAMIEKEASIISGSTLKLMSLMSV